MKRNPPSGAWLDLLLSLLLMAGYVTLLLATTRDLGYARDEGFYFDAARSYAGWFDALLQNPRQALAPATIDRYWAANHEHPALMKSLFALSHRYLYQRWHWFAEAGTAFRFPGMVVSSLAVAVTYAWASKLVGRVAGVVAALLLGFMPRVFYHSHLACFDMPVAAMWLVTTYAYWLSITRGGLWRALLAGVLYGLLLDTKHNAWLLPGALVLHLLFTRGAALWHGLRSGRVLIPLGLVSMAVVGPVVFVAGWPWIWHKTGARLAEYVAFHTGHEYYNMEFLGRTYWKPPMPRAYAWVMTAATVPGITLLLGGIGVVNSIRARIARRVVIPEAGHFETDVLWLLCIAFSYAPWLSQNTPIFGGTKHWITAYPFVCLFAGRGFVVVLEGLRALFGARPWATLALPAGLSACVLAAPVVMTLHSHPWGLSAYTPLVGGAPGAASLGLNRTFWGYTTGAVTGFLNEHVAPDQSVFVHDTSWPSWEMLRSDGRLRSDLRGAWSIDGSSIALYHHEPHMEKVEYQTWVAYGTTTPAHVATYDGVPVIWIYARPGALKGATR